MEFVLRCLHIGTWLLQEDFRNDIADGSIVVLSSHVEMIPTTKCVSRNAPSLILRIHEISAPT
jgi:hypothetical protein